MKYLLTVLSGLIVISGFAQKKDIVPDYELSSIKYLDWLEVHQKMMYSYTDNPDSNQHFELLDTIYYTAKYEPYTYNKKRFKVEATYKIVALTNNNDTIMAKVIHSDDSIVIPIINRRIVKDSYTRIVVYTLSVKKSIKGRESFQFKDKVADVWLSNTRDTRYTVRALGNWKQNCYRRKPIRYWNPHGYNLNQIAVKTIPGVN